MKISYGTSSFAPDLAQNEHQVQIELLGGVQWKKGFTTLNLTMLANGDKHARQQVSDYLTKNEITIKCPKDRKLSAAITGVLIRLFNPEFGIPQAETLLNGVKQVRVVDKKYLISWYRPADDCAQDINYALKA